MDGGEEPIKLVFIRFSFLWDEEINAKTPQSIFYFKNQLYLQLPAFPDIRPYICIENKTENYEN